MRRISFTLVVVFLTVSAVTARAQETEPVPASVPAASRAQAECTGFIATPPLPRDMFVVGGADDDTHSVVRQFVEGESIYVSAPRGGDIAVGAQYSVLRPAHELFLTMHYSGERGEIGRVGKPYEDIGQVKVTHVNGGGVVAKVTFSCETIVPGDILVPFQPRAIPEFKIAKPLDHFAPLDSNKEHGRVVASHNNIGYFGKESVVYLNLGDKDGALPGQRFRIYKNLPPHTTGFMSSQRTPPEVVGEAVILSVQTRSSTAMVVYSYREIAAGDYVEME